MTRTLLLAAIVIFGMGMAAADAPREAVDAKIRAEFPEVATITTGKLATWLADSGRQSPVLLDARSEAEFSVSHLLHARRAGDAETLRAALAGVAADAPIVVYCSVGVRSARLADALRKRGFSNVRNLEGSLFAWANEGRPIFQGTKPATQVHPYDWLWGKMLRAELHGGRAD